MKKDQVPQDQGACYDGSKRVTYALDEAGRYTRVPSSGWVAEIEANAVAIQADNDRIQQAWRDAHDGRKSALAYHMAVVQMDVALLAGETRQWRLSVRRHLRPQIFAKLGPGLLARYAHALGIEVAELVSLPQEPELL